MTETCIGWDVGGAHLKAVLLNHEGRVVAATQVYCPLWRGLRELEFAIDNVLLEFSADRHAVTMTGELADIFASRREGVMSIAATLSRKLSGEVQYYASKHGFVGFDAVAELWSAIASMNWYASVQYVAQHVYQAVFVDIGSTTTDIALIEQAMPRSKGFTDALRMQQDELVYTGVVRTPLMALAQRIPFGGVTSNVAAEHFATTADIYTLTGELACAENAAETADGTEKTVQASARRIARMVGCDVDDAPLASWIELAKSFKNFQLDQIRHALLKQIANSQDSTALQLIGAGAGSFLVAELARQLDLEYHDVTEFIAADDAEAKHMAAVCFPAYAVAYLRITQPGAAA